MSKTIQLLADDDTRINLLLSGAEIRIDGKRYAMTDHDLVRLLMWREEQAERIRRRPVRLQSQDCCDHYRDKPGPNSDEPLPMPETNFTTKTR